MEQKLAFDDVQIIPKYSNILSRSNVDLSTQFTRNYRIKLPFIAAPMDTVCGTDMAHILWQLGGVGVLHRFCSIDEQVLMVDNLKSKMGEDLSLGIFPTDEDQIICAAIGANGDSLERAMKLVNRGVNVLLIDVAHGHHQNVADTLKKLIDYRSTSEHKFDIIAGNVATYEGALFLQNAGADAIRVGVGGGSVCETRIRTGIGYPQFAAVADICSPVKHSSIVHIPVISDGGIRYPGDVAKAIAAGASSVMIGSLFAGTLEAPGDIFISGTWPENKQFKMYRGSASASIKMQKSGHTNHVEGASKMIPFKGSVAIVISDLTDGLSSSLSYVGASNLKEFQQNAEFVRITNAGMREALPHLLYDNT